MNQVQVTEIKASQEAEWDDYLYSNPNGTLYHLACWRRIIRNSYGHKDYYLMAIENPLKEDSKYGTVTIKGILPLVHIKHLIFGNCLISVPFCDYGGILADDSHTEQELVKAAINLADKLGVEEIELRSIDLENFLDEKPIKSSKSSSEVLFNKWLLQVRPHKVRMLFELPESAERLMKSFKSKLRSQIKKPMRAGLETRIGGLELLDDFYTVFSLNMKELGSPVHSKLLIKNVIKEFNNESNLVLVYQGGKPLAGSVVVGYKDTLENPWASSLREYSRLSPNMLLYWTMLAYGCDKNYKKFDFGRSSPGEGTYKFKEQWGAKPVTLHWRYISKKRKGLGSPISEDARFRLASQIWKRLPEPVTKVIGPHVRKYIGL